MKGSSQVHKGNIPHKKLDKHPGHQHVAKGKGAVAHKSSGKMPSSAGGVTLGTQKGNTNVASVL